MKISRNLSPSRDYYLLVFLLSLNIVLMTEKTTATVRLWRDFCFYLVVPSTQLAHKIITHPVAVGQRIKDILRVYEINRVLDAENKLLKSHKNYWREISEENARLRDLLNVRQTLPYRIEIARLTISQRVGEETVGFLDKGTEQMITAGSVVATFWHKRLCLVGIVTQSYSGYSRMLFLNNELVNVPVVVKTETESFSGLLRGSSSGKLWIDYLSGSGDKILGQEVVTASNSRIYPSGLLIGYVRDIRKSVNQISVMVEAPLDYTTLSEVIVILK